MAHKKLETTTIYTRVAVIKDKQVQSPLDVLFGKRAQPVVPAPSKPVGRMQIDLRLRKDDPKAANVTVTILSSRSLHSLGRDRGPRGATWLGKSGASALGAVGEASLLAYAGAAQARGST